MFKKIVQWIPATLLFVPPSGVYAQEEVARLSDLLAEARERNPQLQAARQRWEAATKLPSQAGSLPDPIHPRITKGT